MVFSPQGAWVFDETPLKPAGSIELKRENRTFWMDLPRADSVQVQRMMALRREQQLNKLNRSLVTQQLRRKDKEYQHLQILLCKTTKTPQLQEHENLHLDPLQMNWTNMNSRTLCFVPGANTAFPAVPKRIHTAVLQHMKVALQRSCWIGCFSQVIKNQVFNCRCWLFMTFLLVL